jgi:protocatechuate 3,4-dioxygenase beta subunit
VAAVETAGPYPDRLGMLSNPAFFRRDIREGRRGALLNLTLTITNARNNCSPVANASVEIWQCDANGNYSEYAQPGYNGTGQTFLRGLQTTDAKGNVTFTTVYRDLRLATRQRARFYPAFLRWGSGRHPERAAVPE